MEGKHGCIIEVQEGGIVSRAEQWSVSVGFGRENVDPTKTEVPK